LRNKCFKNAKIIFELYSILIFSHKQTTVGSQIR
jgi:hypothetical protein